MLSGALECPESDAALSNGAGIQYARQDLGNTVGPFLFDLAEFQQRHPEAKT